VKTYFTKHKYVNLFRNHFCIVDKRYDKYWIYYYDPQSFDYVGSIEYLDCSFEFIEQYMIGE
jgi:hypothetical protein